MSYDGGVQSYVMCKYITFGCIQGSKFHQFCEFRTGHERETLNTVLSFNLSTSYTDFLATQQNQLRNVCTVKLMPEMKSGTPNTYTLIPYTGQLNNSVRRLMNWYCVYWHHPGIFNREFQNGDKFEEKCYCNN